MIRLVIERGRGADDQPNSARTRERCRCRTLPQLVGNPESIQIIDRGAIAIEIAYYVLPIVNEVTGNSGRRRALNSSTQGIVLLITT